MHITTISWVRNEADVIEAFVRHHCSFVHRMIIIDNRSKDDTSNILQLLREEGLPLDIRYDDAFIHRQGEAMTDLLQELRDTNTDLVLPLDADEFLWTGSADDPRTALERLSCETATHLPWHTYVPLPEDSPVETHVLKRIRHRKVRENPQWYKVAIPKKLLQTNMEIDIGSHALVHRDTKQSVHHHLSKELFLAHFPVRSVDQIMAKVCSGWPSHVANPHRMPGTIFQWKAIFDRVKAGEIIDPCILKTLALEYATAAQWNMLPTDERGPHTLESFSGKGLPPDPVDMAVVEDPIPVQMNLCYPFHRLSPLQILMESVEYLAQEHANIRQETML
jgi:hypothetical protein